MRAKHILMALLLLIVSGCANISSIGVDKKIDSFFENKDGNSIIIDSYQDKLYLKNVSPRVSITSSQEEIQEIYFVHAKEYYGRSSFLRYYGGFPRAGGTIDGRRTYRPITIEHLNSRKIPEAEIEKEQALIEAFKPALSEADYTSLKTYLDNIEIWYADYHQKKKNEKNARIATEKQAEKDRAALTKKRESEKNAAIAVMQQQYKFKYTPYQSKYRSGGFVTLHQVSPQHLNENYFYSVDFSYYKVLQQTSDNHYLVTSNGEIPVCLESNKQLFEGSHMHTIYATYQGVERYTNTMGSTKQCLIFKEL